MKQLYLFILALAFLGLAVYLGYSFVTMPCADAVAVKNGACGLGTAITGILAGGAGLLCGLMLNEAKP